MFTILKLSIILWSPSLWKSTDSIESISIEIRLSDTMSRIAGLNDLKDKKNEEKKDRNEYFAGGFDNRTGYVAIFLQSM